MFPWLTDDPTTVYFLLATAGLAGLAGMVIRGRAIYLLAVLGVMLLAALVWLADYLVISDNEQVQLNTRAMGDAAERGDIDGIARFISEEFSADGLTKSELLSRAGRYLPPPQRPREVAMWNFETRPAEDGQGLICSCSCRVTGVSEWDGVPVYLEFDYQKEPDGQWRALRLRIMDIATGQQEVIRIPR